MATFFGLPDPDAQNLLNRALSQWHPVLVGLGVRVQIIMAASDNDEPAVKHGGYPALATIRIVPLKDRLTKSYDAEMLVSREDWNLMRDDHRLALLDHELSHIEPVQKEIKPEKGERAKPDEPKRYYTPLDDLGRPKLKLRKGDWNAGDGFREVVARHGDAAAEFENLRRAYAVAQAAAEEGPSESAADSGHVAESFGRLKGMVRDGTLSFSVNGKPVGGKPDGEEAFKDKVEGMLTEAGVAFEKDVTVGG